MRMQKILFFLASVFLFHTDSQFLSKKHSEFESADRVTLTTSFGKILIRLRTDVAPGSTAMFARLVRSGLYDGCVFYRAEDFCIQGGLRTADGHSRVNPFGHFPFEYALQNKRGTVTLARWQDVNSATGEFFINLKDSPHLDRTGTSGWGLGFAVFGEVESGMDVVERIAAQPTNSQGGMSMLATSVPFQATMEAFATKNTIPSASAPTHLSINIGQAGVVAVKLLPNNAPHLVAVVKKLVQHGASGKIHRAEAIPVPPSQGPPYALVQATLDDPGKRLAKMPHEGSLPIERGSVCIIPGSSDFFISLGAHPGWEVSMTVVGEVSPAALEQVVMPILQRPHHRFTHPTFGTVMSMLDSPIQIHVSLAADDGDYPTPLSDSETSAAEALAEKIDREADIMLMGTHGYKDL